MPKDKKDKAEKSKPEVVDYGQVTPYGSSDPAAEWTANQLAIEKNREPEMPLYVNSDNEMIYEQPRSLGASMRSIPIYDEPNELDINDEVMRRAAAFANLPSMSAGPEPEPIGVKEALKRTAINMIPFFGQAINYPWVQDKRKEWRDYNARVAEAEDFNQRAKDFAAKQLSDSYIEFQRMQRTNHYFGMLNQINPWALPYDNLRAAQAMGSATALPDLKDPEIVMVMEKPDVEGNAQKYLAIKQPNGAITKRTLAGGFQEIPQDRIAQVRSAGTTFEQEPVDTTNVEAMDRWQQEAIARYKLKNQIPANQALNDQQYMEAIGAEQPTAESVPRDKWNAILAYLSGGQDPSNLTEAEKGKYEFEYQMQLASGKAGVQFEKEAKSAGMKEVVESAGTLIGARRMYESMMQAAKNSTLRPSGPDDMVLLSLHMSMTFGDVKGARMGRDLIEAHMRTRSLPDSMQVLANKVLNGERLSENQRRQFLQAARDRVIELQAAYDRTKTLWQFEPPGEAELLARSPDLTPEDYRIMDAQSVFEASKAGDPLAIDELKRRYEELNNAQ